MLGILTGDLIYAVTITTYGVNKGSRCNDLSHWYQSLQQYIYRIHFIPRIHSAKLNIFLLMRILLVRHEPWIPLIWKQTA
jgi:hypothetical protein